MWLEGLLVRVRARQRQILNAVATWPSLGRWAGVTFGTTAGSATVGDRPNPRRSTAGPCAPRTRKRARATLVATGPDRQEPRCVCRAPTATDRGRRARATRSHRSSHVTLRQGSVRSGQQLGLLGVVF